MFKNKEEDELYGMVLTELTLDKIFRNVMKFTAHEYKEAYLGVYALASKEDHLEGTGERLVVGYVILDHVSRIMDWEYAYNGAETEEEKKAAKEFYETEMEQYPERFRFYGYYFSRVVKFPEPVLIHTLENGHYWFCFKKSELQGHIPE